MLCPWREVYAGFEDFRLEKANDILVYGAGPVGLSFTRFAKGVGAPQVLGRDNRCGWL